MQHGFFDRYATLRSPVHALDPRIQLALALSVILLAASAPPEAPGLVAVYLGLLGWVAALSRIPLRYFAARLAVVLPFVAVLALCAPLLPPEPGGRTWGVLGLTLSHRGLLLAASVVLKALAAATAVLLVTATTPFSRLLDALRALGAPGLLLDLLAFLYRYLFVLVGEAERLERARAARGWSGRWLGQAGATGRLVGTLFLRAYERAERVYAAMCARGYTAGGGVAAAEALPAPRAADWLVLALAAAGLVALRYLLS